MPSASMTQAEIDAFLNSVQNSSDIKTSNNSEQSNNASIEEKEIQYHKLICIYCKSIIELDDIKTHCLLTVNGCKKNEYGHKFLSEGWLHRLKENNVFGWRQIKPLQNKCRTKKIKTIKQPS